MKDKLTDLCGNWRFQNNLINTLKLKCTLRASPLSSNARSIALLACGSDVCVWVCGCAGLLCRWVCARECVCVCVVCVCVCVCVCVFEREIGAGKHLQLRPGLRSFGVLKFRGVGGFRVLMVPWDLGV